MKTNKRYITVNGIVYTYEEYLGMLKNRFFAYVAFTNFVE